MRWKKSGGRGEPPEGSKFEDDRPCIHPGHHPPTQMVIPYGKKYRHVCPGCGKVTLVRMPFIHWA